MPPMFTMTRCTSPPNSAAWNAGTSGAPLAAGGDVATAKVGHDGHVGVLRHARRIVDLQRPAFVRSVPHRLPVDAGGDDIVRGNVCSGAYATQCVHVEIGQHVRRARRAHDFVLRRRPAMPEVPGAVAVGKSICVAASSEQVADPGREIREHGIDPVEARPGHHARVEFAAHGDARPRR